MKEFIFLSKNISFFLMINILKFNEFSLFVTIYYLKWPKADVLVLRVLFSYYTRERSTSHLKLISFHDRGFSTNPQQTLSMLMRFTILTYLLYI